jgi:hypothetical protein
MGEGLKRARKAAKATRERPKDRLEPDGDFPLTISFDSAELRSLFRGWLSDGGGEQDFMQCVDHERGTTLDIDYDSEDLVVVNEVAAE